MAGDEIQDGIAAQGAKAILDEKPDRPRFFDGDVFLEDPDIVHSQGVQPAHGFEGVSPGQKLSVLDQKNAAHAGFPRFLDHHISAGFCPDLVSDAFRFLPVLRLSDQEDELLREDLPFSLDADLLHAASHQVIPRAHLINRHPRRRLDDDVPKIRSQPDPDHGVRDDESMEERLLFPELDRSSAEKEEDRKRDDKVLEVSYMHGIYELA